MRTHIPELVTAPEAARRLGVPRKDMAEAIRDGRVKAVRVRFGLRVLELIYMDARRRSRDCDECIHQIE